MGGGWGGGVVTSFQTSPMFHYRAMVGLRPHIIGTSLNGIFGSASEYTYYNLFHILLLKVILSNSNHHKEGYSDTEVVPSVSGAGPGFLMRGTGSNIKREPYIMNKTKYIF